MISEEEIREKAFRSGWRPDWGQAAEIFYFAIGVKGEDKNNNTVESGLWSGASMDYQDIRNCQGDEGVKDLKKAKENNCFRFLVGLVEESFNKSIIKMPRYYIDGEARHETIPVTNLRLA